MTKRFGFTLAEVLITLGIIGVVASMTIPTLMVDINAKQWSTAKNVFNKKLNEAMKNMNTAQVIAGHPNTLSFVEELSKHYKINKICKNDELQSCFSDIVWWGGGEAQPEKVDMTTISQASHFGLEDWGTELIGVQFANGVSGLVAYNPKCSGDPYSNQFKGTDCISILYDVSGSKNPNTSGKDLGNFGVINRLGGATCAFKIGETCYGTPFLASSISKEECESNKSSLGIQGCYRDDDYWAGAVKACGGVGNLPTAQQLQEIAQLAYPSIASISNGVDAYSSCPGPNTHNYCRDDDFLTSVGLSIIVESNSYVWTREEGSNEDAYYRMFGPYGTSYSSYYREDDAKVAICIVN